MAADNREQVAEALVALGRAWRMDWSDFDGRTLRAQLEELAKALMATEPFDFNNWCVSHEVCPEGGGWESTCSTSVGFTCDHGDALRAARTA